MLSGVPLAHVSLLLFARFVTHTLNAMMLTSVTLLSFLTYASVGTHHIVSAQTLQSIATAVQNIHANAFSPGVFR